MDLLIEVGTEELPPASVVPSLDFMAEDLVRRAKEARLEHGAVETFGTPRRVALCVADVAARSGDLVETKLGPASRIAFDESGNPTKAALGFAKGQGVEVSDLLRVTTEKGEYVAARIVEEGRAARDVLPGILEAILSGIPWPKPMHWGWTAESWGRPIHWLVALLDEEVLPVRFTGVESGRWTFGHRFADPDPIELARPGDYETALEAHHVIPSVAKRRAGILRLAMEAAAPHRLVRDAGLLDEVTQLVEYPLCARGAFDESYLVLPREVLVSEMREHQRYFAVEDGEGRLVNHFVVVYNTPVHDPEVVVRGNERVLAARLADGAFFLKRDRARRLDSRVEDLARVVFLKGLGTIRDKVARMVDLSAALSEALFGDDGDVARVARRAAHLAKADLTTEMVGEFPELQGIMGREYARLDGEPETVAVAIAEHYQPRGAADAVPGSKAGIIVSMADKLDSLAGCFALGLEPTGTADPYGLRRAALGIIRMALEHRLVFSLRDLVDTALVGVKDQFGDRGAVRDRLATPEGFSEVSATIVEFFGRRLRVYLADQAKGDVIDAVLATGLDDISGSAARVRALSAMRDRDGFEPLAVAFKRVANILQRPPDGAVNESLFESDAERDLWRAYQAIRGRVSDRIVRRDFEGAAEALIELKEPVDRFFDDVMVMAEDEALRRNRLSLLRDLRGLFAEIADISRIQVTVQ